MNGYYKPAFKEHSSKKLTSEDVKIIKIVKKINSNPRLLVEVEELIRQKKTPNEAASIVLVKKYGIQSLHWDFRQQTNYYIQDKNGKPAKIIWNNNQLRYYWDGGWHGQPVRDGHEEKNVDIEKPDLK